MKTRPASIFNDVIGPVMVGPSSSHTAGPARIGFLAGQLAVGGVAGVVVRFDKNGSFAATYKGQKSDQGLAAGFLGMRQDDPGLSQALDTAGARGVPITFVIDEFEAPHPNTAVMHIQDMDGGVIQARGISTGGGKVVVDQIEGCATAVLGDYYELAAVCPSAAGQADYVRALHSLLAEQGLDSHGEQVSDNGLTGAGERRLHVTHLRRPVPEKCLRALRDMCPTVRLAQLKPVMPVLASRQIAVPFATAEAMQEYCRAEKLPLWRAAQIYEAARGGMSEEGVMAMAGDIVLAMRRSLTHGLTGDFTMAGFLSPSAPLLDQARQQGRFIPCGFMDQGLVYATAIMELNAAMGCVVAAPTAGSCGVLPAALFSALDNGGRSAEEGHALAARAVLAAGLVGVFISEQATFAAEVCGCQAECGAAAAITAAALADAFGASADQACLAAALALQNSLGLICDPVAEQVEVPCISRNASALGNAFASANMALFGFQGALPLDDVIGAMWDVGQLLPASLRCTGRGGLCATLAGRRIKQMVDMRNR